MTNHVLPYMQPLTKQLQATKLDIITAYEEGKNVHEVIAKQRCERGFSVSFEKPQLCCDDAVLAKQRISVQWCWQVNWYGKL